MNDTTRLVLDPEVARFVKRVRVHLTDLSEEEREELVGGLEADLSDLVADGGELGGLDPAAYAAELRTAAGLDAAGRAGPRRGVWSYRPPTSRQLGARLDAARSLWDEQVNRSRWSAAAWDMARTLRPAWWVLRAWVAVQLLDLATGPAEYLTVVPSLGNQLLGLLVLLGAVAGSALLGMRRLRADGAAVPALPERLVLLTLNGVRPLYNVFPLPVREQGLRSRHRSAWVSGRPPTLPSAPLAVVPPASLPSRTPTASPSTAPTAGPSAHPTRKPGATPTERPGARPTARPGATPTARPGAGPTRRPAAGATRSPAR
ncbi:MAG: hypothetical protein QOC80_3124 [Frankiaceae bacterium]|nr:hypothetical protein [Frankiaceae bacterium]